MKRYSGPILGTMLAIALLLLWRYPAKAPEQGQPSANFPLAKSAQKTTSLLAVGDIMLSRNVGTKIDKADDPNLPFANLQSLISSADIAFGNLECPLSPSAVPVREGLIFRCLSKYVPGLVNAGFDVLSTANNHSFDQGGKGLEFTIDYLKSHSILPVGTGKDFAEVHSGRVIRVSEEGVRLGFLAYSYSARNDGQQSTDPHIATMDNLDQLKTDILNLKSRGAQVVIVSMHAGTEYTREPNQLQINFAHAAIDAGADAVIGHHPHWIQPVEVYSPTIQLSPDEGRVPRSAEAERGREVKSHHGLIFYSLGNFVFDQMWSQETRKGLAVELTFREHELQSAKLIPVIIDNFCCPRLATPEEKAAILKKINLESDIIEFPSP